MKELTKAEKQIMQYVWEIEKGFLKDIVNKFPEPKPAYTTVSTVVGVLVKKGFINFNSYGKIREYYAVVSRKDYSKVKFKDMLKSFFGNSTQKFASFFMKENDMSLTELEELKKLVEEEIERNKNK